MTTATLPAATAVTRPTAPWRALPILLLGAFLPILDAFIVNVALPTIGRTLNAGPAALELTVSGYGVAYACTLVAGGRLGDRFGRKRMLLIGMSAFTVASAACGLAPTAGALIAFRILQGLGAALLFPQVLASIQAGFEGADRQKALGLFGSMAGLAGAVGQILGGALLAWDVAGLGWRPLFLINVPVGIAAVVLGRRFVPESRAPRATGIDVWGALLLAATIALLLLPVTLGRTEGWPLWTWLSLAAVVPAAVAFFWTQARQERRGGNPLLPPSLLSLRLARRALLAILLFATLIGGFLFTVAVTLQMGHGFGPMAAGLAMGPCAITFLYVSLRVGRWVSRYGVRVLIGGALIFGLGIVAFAAVIKYTDHLTVIEAAVPLVVVGVGWAMVLSPAIGFVLSGLPADRAGLAGGVLSTAMQLGLALGASLLGSLLFATSQLVALGCCLILAVSTAIAYSRLRS
ncbi:MAG: MFS transporter [Hamadaea sp.]|nr:MFS transporter [Hamadaea sp.]NUR51336.1 MFS transporter [Hamadaea sp.]NUT06900.1 MFS transporter [Hamadaea sp.]